METNDRLLNSSSGPATREQLFALLVESIRDYAIIMIDADGFVVSWNEGARRIKGYKDSEIIGQHFSIFYPEKERSTKPAFELKTATVEGSFEDEGWRLRKDGSMFWANVIVTALRDPSGRLLGFAKITRDLTERKTAEEALRLARDQALQAADLKARIAANLSHEVRTPLAGMIGMAELLTTDSLLNSDQMQTAEYIYSSGQRLLSVVNDLLDFSRLESGKAAALNADFVVNDIVKEAATLMLPIAKSKNIKLSYALDAAVPTNLRGDAEKILQCLLNFLHNALKFTAAGGEVSISVSEDGIESGSKAYTFSVADSGIGVDKETQAKLFEPFVQAGDKIRKAYGGTGLGLSIVRGNVQLMHGRVGIESAPGKGARFWFKVPLEMASNKL